MIGIYLAIVSFLTARRGQKVKIVVPKKGSKEQLVELAEKNARMVLSQDKEKIKREELAAFGDNYNDMTMIGYAGFGVAMGNAETDVKKIADYICESNDNDGIANTLDKFVLKQ